jgi:hypothetical protein
MSSLTLITKGLMFLVYTYLLSLANYMTCLQCCHGAGFYIHRMAVLARKLRHILKLCFEYYARGMDYFASKLNEAELMQ